MNLPEIRLRRVSTHTRQMLHGCPEVGVSFYAEAGDKADGFAAWLREAVFVVAVHGDHACGCHHTIVPYGDCLIEECTAINAGQRFEGSAGCSEVGDRHLRRLRMVLHMKAGRCFEGQFRTLEMTGTF